ncbi:NAD kinase [Parapedobacter sp. SGR-10]|uniref:NAD kinase n=1 Tax=Parapedobacter sp. SGR-10 TaxID=2710879 RepID=UPI0013D122EB|nr:NAD kinase [Parapedobacter sp. SGR-10]NGF57454.1 NAD kinase [Parapedobacter sp. SGR-10]
MKPARIAIYGRFFNTSVNPFVENLFAYLRSKGIEVCIHQEFYEFLKSAGPCPIDLPTFRSYEDFPKDVDFMLSLGGDGTMLSAVSIVRDSNIPIAGINFGRLGFLANIPKTEIRQALEQIFEGKYHIQKRALLTVEADDRTLFHGENFALNDITVFRFDSSSMITIDARLNGELLNSYWSDGLIIATPTGSTAYSLSCGGPIIMPGSGNFVITPISPHNLNVRPLVVSSDMHLELTIESRSEKFILSCDSRSEALPTSTRLLIKRAPFTINLIRLEGDGYFKTLREKLLWGIDVRNY